MYKISIIIPMYNVEEFLNDAMQSILNQTIGFENLEVLFIDDCSTDNSGEIAKDFSENYKNVIYYKLPENSGMAGKPRNIGIKMASAKYVMFLDPDDFYSKDACELMYNTIERENVQFVTANLKAVDMVGNDLNKIYVDREKYKSQIIEIDKIKEALKMMKISCCVKIINREFLLNNDICFLEGVPAEDAYFTNKMFMIARKCYYQNEPILCYRRRDSGNVSETNNLIERFFIRMTEANRIICDLFKEFNEIKFYQCYWIENFLYIIRALILSQKIGRTEKAKLLLNMKSLLIQTKEWDIDFKVKSDIVGFLKVYSIENEKDYSEYMERMENEFKHMSIDEIKSFENKLKDELYQQI